MRRTSMLIAAALACGALAAPADAAPRRTVDAQILGLNDFHGALEATTGLTWAGQPAGGVEYLASRVERLERGEKHSLVVSAGDLVGASPLLSALFHDEPTIEAMNALGLDINAVGNHEFDEGAAELLRLQNGGCHPVDGCQDGDGFGGADFQFLAANVFRAGTGDTLLPPYTIKKMNGERVAFVGMTLEGTPSVVSAEGIAGLEFRDEAETVNALVPELRRRGAQAVVVVLHEGGVQSGGEDECAGISGPVVDIVDRTSQEVDLFITGHTHRAYDCVIDGRPVTSAGSNGRLITDIDLRIDKRTGEPTKIATDNLVVTRDVERDPEQTELIEKYAALAAPIAGRTIGSTTAPITRETDGDGESALGNLIADAQRASTGAQIAFMNPGGVRADLDAGDVTYGEAFSVQPFGNTLVTLELTGAQIDALLEQQWAGQASPRVLSPSSGFAYTYSAGAPAGQKVDPASIRLDGAPVDPGATYRVTVNSFLADGGDNFTVLREGTNRVGGAVDVDALEAYLAARSPVAPPATDRISAG